jgi:hypothetical protein
METPAAINDPVALIRQLRSDEIRQRIKTIEAERKALMVLLRAALRVDTSGDRREVATRG